MIALLTYHLKIVNGVRTRKRVSCRKENVAFSRFLKSCIARETLSVTLLHRRLSAEIAIMRSLFKSLCIDVSMYTRRMRKARTRMNGEAPIVAIVIKGRTTRRPMHEASVHAAVFRKHQLSQQHGLLSRMSSMLGIDKYGKSCETKTTYMTM